MVKAPQKRKGPPTKAKIGQLVSWFEDVPRPDGTTWQNLQYGVVVRMDRRSDRGVPGGTRILYRCVRVKTWSQAYPYGGTVSFTSQYLTVYPRFFPHAVKKYRANKALVPEGVTEWNARGCVCNCCNHVRGNYEIEKD